MKFRFYITDLHAGSIFGTNDESLAKDYAQSEDHFVADTETGLWLQTADHSSEIEAATDFRTGEQS